MGVVTNEKMLGAASTARRRIGGLAWLVVGTVLVIVLAGDWVEWLRLGDYSTVGMDFRLYQDAASTWVAGGPFYQPYQLAGPYAVSPGDILYPPPMLLLLVPFSILPAVFWWLIPISIVGAVVAYHRPQPLAILGIIFCVFLPTSAVKLVHGNPVMWIAAVLALGTIWRWPAVAVLLKPTLAPFALIGARRRSWWLALLVLAIVALAFLPMWPDYVRVILDAQDPAGPLYSLNDVPIVWVPVLAWLGGRRPPAIRSGLPMASAGSRAAPPATGRAHAGSPGGEGRSTLGGDGRP